MALHRDIFWVGRQWAVTGHGLQAVDQKQKSKFDIEICRLWAGDLTDGLSAERWFNAEDFSKGLSIARARYPGPSGAHENAQPPQPFEPEPEPMIASAPVRPQPSPPTEIASVARPQHAPKAEPPEPDLLKPDVPKPNLPKPSATAAPSHDTWASLAELARNAATAPSRKAPQPVMPPEPIAPPTPRVFAPPAKPLPRFDAAKPATVTVEPPKPTPPLFDMRVESCGAKFSRMWRVGVRR